MNRMLSTQPIKLEASPRSTSVASIRLSARASEKEVSVESCQRLVAAMSEDEWTHIA